MKTPRPDGYTQTERQNDANLSSQLRRYLYPLLMQRQDGICAHCVQPLVEPEIDHKRYGPDITIDDLQMVCHDCHIELGKERGQWMPGNRLLPGEKLIHPHHHEPDA